MNRKTPSKTPPLRLDERVGYRFSIITKRLNQALAAMHSKKLGLSVNNWKIMSVIAFFAPLSATELGARTSLDPDKITRAIDTLVQRGYVIRKHDEIDRRKVVLSLSANGKRVHDKIERVASALEVEFLSVLSLEERKALHSSLTKLEQHSSVFFGRREGWFERRSVPGVAVRAPKPQAKTGTRVRKTDARGAKPVIRGVTIG
jgi:DNA-binding MarR family transcriptional regulator